MLCCFAFLFCSCLASLEVIVHVNMVYMSSRCRFIVWGGDVGGHIGVAIDQNNWIHLQK